MKSLDPKPKPSIDDEDDIWEDDWEFEDDVL